MGGNSTACMFVCLVLAIVKAKGGWREEPGVTGDSCCAPEVSLSLDFSLGGCLDDSEAAFIFCCGMRSPNPVVKSPGPTAGSAPPQLQDRPRCCVPICELCL